MKFVSIVTAIALISAGIEAKTFLFPVPQSVVWASTSSLFASDFKIEGVSNKWVNQAADRYTKLIKKEKWVPVQVSSTDMSANTTNHHLTGISFDIQDQKAKLDYGIDESYSLTVPENGGKATVKAATWVGALRALETFSQLVVSENDKSVVHAVTISDSPTYPHRGILLDTARNFYPVEDILRTIQAQAYNKMNVLHWHITDSQSWPLQLKSHPELAAKGAYSKKETYSANDIQTVIKFAESRGIRVVVEIDMPAHTASIADSHPDLLVCQDEFWAAYSAEPPAGQLNPLSDEAHSLVQDIVTEVTSIFPDSIYHAGGDEINGACWELNNDIASYLNQTNSTTNMLWNDWTNKLLDFIGEETKKRPIIWEDGVTAGGQFPTNTIIQTWVTPPANFTSAGYDVIVANYDYFYLDCGHGGWVGNDNRYISPTQTQTADDTFNYGGVGGSWCSPFKTWQRIYSYDLTYGIDTDGGKVLGGEAALWAEQSGPTVVDGRLWPRSAAAAEIFWSGSYDNQGVRRTVQTASERFYDWVYRLQARGINAEPVQPKWCAKHPGGCDLNDPNAAATRK